MLNSFSKPGDDGGQIGVSTTFWWRIENVLVQYQAPNRLLQNVQISQAGLLLGCQSLCTSDPNLFYEGHILWCLLID